jgi:hypothetical protein
VKVLDQLADDMRLRPAGTASAPAAEDTATNATGRHASVLVHIATMYVDAGNTERAKATLVEAARTTTKFQKDMLASERRQGMRGATHPVVSSPLRDVMVAQDLSTQQQHPSQRPGVFVVLWTMACAAFGFVAMGLIKPIIEAFGKGIVGRAVADYFRNEGLASALGVKLTSSLETPIAKETKQAENPL